MHVFHYEFFLGRIRYDNYKCKTICVGKVEQGADPEGGGVRNKLHKEGKNFARMRANAMHFSS